MNIAEKIAMQFSLIWESRNASHTDHFFLDKLLMSRDIFPGNMEQALKSLQPGDCHEEQFAAGELTEAASSFSIKRFHRKDFRPSGQFPDLIPRQGRFYPQGFASVPLNTFESNFHPFRLIRIENDQLTADKNHPLANYPLTLKACYLRSAGAVVDHGGMCHDIAETVTAKGPGMQAPADMPTDFYSDYPFRRMDELDDSLFYSLPRTENLVTEQVSAQIRQYLTPLLSGKKRILDLMCSDNSHLPELSAQVSVTGLGMNPEEMAHNPGLSLQVQHDLNKQPELPFDDNSFDAVICTAGIEYLTQPLEVIRDIARIATPGAPFVVAFSDQWFPTKVIELWTELHAFERLGLVLDYFHQSGCFEKLHTESFRGYPHPAFIVSGICSDKGREN